MMDFNPRIETIRKVWTRANVYLLLRPWPKCPSHVELCTGDDSDSRNEFGHISIIFGKPESLKVLAQALMIAADEMEANNG